MTDRYAEHRQIARALGVDAAALVPGPNFTRLFHQDFHSHERPLVVLIPVEGTPAALVPNLELRSFDLLKFEGEVFDWRDQTGYADALAALAKHLPLRSVAVEGQVMRVFVHHAMATAWPDLCIVDAERQISGLRLHKLPDEVAALEDAIRLSERAFQRTLEQVRIGQTEKEIEQILTLAIFAEGADEQSFGPIVAAGDNSARMPMPEPTMPSRLATRCCSISVARRAAFAPTSPAPSFSAMQRTRRKRSKTPCCAPTSRAMTSPAPA